MTSAHLLTKLPLLAFGENAALTQTEFAIMRIVLLVGFIVLVAILALMFIHMSTQGNGLKRQVANDYGLKLSGEELRIAAAGNGIYRVSKNQVLTYDSEHNRMVLQALATP